MTRRSLLTLSAAPLMALAAPVFAGRLSDERTGLGLKEALSVATGNAIGKTGKLNGYFKNKAIKILLPKQLSSVEKLLRTFGQGDQVDQLVKGMNRAAERAAPQAGQFFTDAIKELSFSDVRKILTGGDTSATSYFKEKTGLKIADAFSPIVTAEMDKVGVTRQFKALTEKARNLPFGESVAVDIDKYVVNQAVNGLFHVMGEEERNIRRNPVARVTDILKEVFGR